MSMQCYPDRKHGAVVRRYESSVEALHVPYIVPGECGGRVDVRWLALRSSAGEALVMHAGAGTALLQASVSRCTVLMFLPCAVTWLDIYWPET